MFYVNNYIDWDQFNPLYDLDQIEKNIRNADAIACKLGPSLTRTTNNRLEVFIVKRQKKEEMKKKQKAKAMTVKRCRARGGMGSFIKKEDESDSGNDTNPDQTKDKYPL